MNDIYSYLITTLCVNFNGILVGRELEEEEGREFDKHCQLKEVKKLLGHNLTIATIEDPPISWTEMVEGKRIGKGVAFDIVEILVDKFGFNYDVIVPEKNIIGDEKEGLLNLLVEKKADMVASFLPMFGEYMEKVQYGNILTDMAWGVLLKRPKDSATGSGLLAPFDTTVWVLILVALIVVGPVIYVIIWFREKVCKNDPRITEVYPLAGCIWFVYGALMKQGSTINPLTDSSRLLFATWWIFITLLTSFYTANLTAFLTLSKFTLPINSAYEMARYRYYWGYQKGTALEQAIKVDPTLIYLKNSLKYRYGAAYEKTDKDMLEMVYKTDIKFLRERDVLEYLMFRDYWARTKGEIPPLGSVRCPYVAMPGLFMNVSVAFAFPYNSTYYERFDSTFQALMEMGIVRYLIKFLLPTEDICPLDLGTTERQLSNADLSTTYWIVLGGFGVSVLAFCFEIALRHCRCCPGEMKVSNDGKAAWNTKHDLINAAAKNLNKENWKNINGRDYMIMPGKNGDSRLVPMRTPSAYLFQYSAYH